MANDTQTILQYEAAKKSAGVAYLLWFFFDPFGGHRFYLGRTGSAVGILLLFIALGIWLIVDAFLIPGIVSEYNTNLV